MKEVDRQTFTIKCQCIVMNNNLPLNHKKKSKFSVLKLQPNTNSILVEPYGLQKGEEKTFAFSIDKLRTIHKKYIEEGKITLEFFQKSERVAVKGTDMSAIEQQDVFSAILISSASKENLQLMIKKIIELKKRSQPKEKKKQMPNECQSQVKPERKKRNVDLSEPEQKMERLNRKELRTKASNPIKSERWSQPKQKAFDLFILPYSLREQIFEYCPLSLYHRLINKNFANYVLEQVHTIRLKDEVDEPTFNKLAMWAVNVECRMRNVRKINLKDKFQDQMLVRNRAKSLKFGDWKQITAKNIIELKGLRTFCIELPYSIKFQLSHIFGQRMVELRFKGTTLSNNQYIKVEDLAYVINHVRELRVLQIPFSNCSLLSLIQEPKKFQELRIYALSDWQGSLGWTDFQKFENLEIFSCWYLQIGGIRKENHEIDIKFPQHLRQLEIGSFISKAALDKFPIQLQCLRLFGSFFSHELSNMVLPLLKELDVTQSPNVRPQIIEYLQNVMLKTCWDCNTLDYMRKYAIDRNIRLQTTAQPYKN